MRQFSFKDGVITTPAEPFEVQVPPVGGTGFAWEPKVDPGSFVIASKRVKPASSFGGAALVVYEFRPLHRGHYTLKFALSAPWEHSAREERTIQVDVV